MADTLPEITSERALIGRLLIESASRVIDKDAADNVQEWIRRAWHNDVLPALAAVPATTGGEPVTLIRSIIHDCPAIKLPQSWVQKLGNVAQIVVLKGATDAVAQELVTRLNTALAVPSPQGQAPSVEAVMATANAASKRAFDQLVALATMGSREFRDNPGCDYISRDAVMAMIPALRDSISTLQAAIRQAIQGLAQPVQPSVQGVRMLTEDEAMDAYSLMDGDASFLDRDPTWMDRMTAAMQKFCEVNGLSLQSGHQGQESGG